MLKGLATSAHLNDQSVLKGGFREEIDTIVHNSPIWSWRWSKMSGHEREERQTYYVCKRLAEHTEVFDEALKYTMLFQWTIGCRK